MSLFARLLTGAALALWMSVPAFAGAGTVTGKDAAGTTHTWDVITDGGGNFVWMQGICDGVAAAQCAAVKAASTAAVATDPAMVVAISPNNAVASTQSGTWNITNVTGTVSLPTGAATAALQPTNAAQGSATSGQTGHLIEGAVTTAAPGYTTAQTSPLSLDTAGNLRSLATQAGTWNITNISGTVSLPTGASTSALQPTNAAQASTTSGQTGHLMQGAVTTAAPAYTTAQTDPLSLDTAGNLRTQVASWAGTAITNTPTAVGTAGSGNTPTLNTFMVGCVSTVCNANGAATPNNSSPVVVSPWTPFLANAITTTKLAVKASGGQFGGIQCYNPNSSQIYVQLFNVASGSVTLGVTAPNLSIPIGPTATGGWAQEGGFAFGTAITAAATSTATGSTAPTTAPDCNIAFN